MEKYSGISVKKLAEDVEAPASPTEESPKDAPAENSSEPPAGVEESVDEMEAAGEDPGVDVGGDTGEEEPPEEEPTEEIPETPQEIVLDALENEGQIPSNVTEDIIRLGVWDYFMNNLSSVVDPDDPKEYKEFAIDKLRKAGINYGKARLIAKSLIDTEF